MQHIVGKISQWIWGIEKLDININENNEAFKVRTIADSWSLGNFNQDVGIKMV